MGARGATGLVLTVASEVFEESGRSLVRGTLDYLQGLKVCIFNRVPQYSMLMLFFFFNSNHLWQMLGVKRIERVLPTGTSLTIVGEVVLAYNILNYNLSSPLLLMNDMGLFFSSYFKNIN